MLPAARAEDFVSHLSVLDALFDVGPARTRRLVLAGQRDWMPRRAMLAMIAAARAEPRPSTIARADVDGDHRAHVAPARARSWPVAIKKATVGRPR